MAITQYPQAMEYAYRTGHFWSPFNPEGVGVSSKQIKKIKPTDSVGRNALLSLSYTMAKRYHELCIEEHGRAPHYDGELGPAMARLLDPKETPRCANPDYAPPPNVSFSFRDKRLAEVVGSMQQDAVLEKTGTGGWNGCLGYDDEHTVVIRWHTKNFPSHLKNGVFEKILRQVRLAYALIGLRIIFVDDKLKDLITRQDRQGIHVNIESHFVASSNGWIGLAILGFGQTCNGNIWAQFLNSWMRGQPESKVINEWVSLLLHEYGHNCGLNHLDSGHMYWSTIFGLQPIWTYGGDPAVPYFVRWFGGEKIILDSEDDTDNTPPTPDDEEATIEFLLKRYNELSSRLSYQEGLSNSFMRRITELEQSK